MTEARAGGDWDAEFRPRMTARYAYGIAALIMAAGLTVAVLLKDRSTGPVLRTADQFAMAGLAAVLAGGVLLLIRPRLRVGAAGLAVRNVLGYRLIPWDEVVDVSFPPGKRWARVDLAYDEYVPVLAVQSFDRELAVAAMDTVRESMDRYR
jgi:hypothetical protein